MTTQRLMETELICDKTDLIKKFEKECEAQSIYANFYQLIDN